MARPKKNGTYLNVCIETPVYSRLVTHCEITGQSKTTAVERALLAYFDDYDEKQRKLKAIEDNKTALADHLYEEMQNNAKNKHNR